MNSKSNYYAQYGEFDLRGFEVVRAEYFTFQFARNMTFSTKGVRFSPECIRSLNSTDHIKILIHPVRKILIVKPCLQVDKWAIRWTTVKNDIRCSKLINGAAYIKTLRELFNWLPEYIYRFRGCVKDSSYGRVLEFGLDEPEIITPEKILYPDDWSIDFGVEYYEYVRSHYSQEVDNDVFTHYIYNAEPQIHSTSIETINLYINNIVDSLKHAEASSGANSDT